MKFLLGLLIALASLTASADWIAHNGRDTVIATKQACPKEMVDFAKDKMPPEALKLLKLAKVTVDGKEYTACWIGLKGVIGLFYEDGDVGVIPESDFKLLTEI